MRCHERKSMIDRAGAVPIKRRADLEATVLDALNHYPASPAKPARGWCGVSMSSLDALPMLAAPWRYQRAASAPGGIAGLV